MSVVCCVVAASLLVASCGSNSSSEDPAAAQQTISLPVDAPRVTLTKSGSGEQQVLAFSGAPEQSVPVTVTSGFRQQTLAGDDAATLSDPPRTHLFFGADYPGELYELLGLWNFAASAPWLSVTPVTTYTENEWWVGATEHSVAPRGLHLPQYGSLSSIVSSYGSWEDRDVLIAGPNEVVRDVVNTLLASGTPASHIQHDPF